MYKFFSTLTHWAGVVGNIFLVSEKGYKENSVLHSTVSLGDFPSSSVHSSTFSLMGSGSRIGSD